jgi:dienelactone hydrolase
MSKIEITSELFREEGIIAYKAQYITNQKRMSTQLIVPDIATPSAGFPVILMVRGFVDPSIYETGMGTKNAARVFAKNGYVTIAPDFLGFGDSAPPPTDTLEARFERPQQLLDLLASLKTIQVINPDRIGIWGHSNGGQISISLLEVSGKSYPTVLWAPVTKPFPYSILYYTDDSNDGGKELRKVLANFEKDYDVYDFSVDKHLSSINAPIELHQGSADTAVPITWSNTFADTLKKANKDISYFTYDGADHNLQPAWNTAIARSLAFFNKNL